MQENLKHLALKSPSFPCTPVATNMHKSHVMRPSVPLNTMWGRKGILGLKSAPAPRQLSELAGASHFPSIHLGFHICNMN